MKHPMKYNLDLCGATPLKVSEEDRANVSRDYFAAAEHPLTPENARAAYLELGVEAMFPVEVET